MNKKTEKPYISSLITAPKLLAILLALSMIFIPFPKTSVKKAHAVAIADDATIAVIALVGVTILFVYHQTRVLHYVGQGYDYFEANELAFTETARAFNSGVDEIKAFLFSHSPGPLQICSVSPHQYSMPAGGAALVAGSGEYCVPLNMPDATVVYTSLPNINLAKKVIETAGAAMPIANLTPVPPFDPKIKFDTESTSQIAKGIIQSAFALSISMSFSTLLADYGINIPTDMNDMSAIESFSLQIDSFMNSPDFPNFASELGETFAVFGGILAKRISLPIPASWSLGNLLESFKSCAKDFKSFYRWFSGMANIVTPHFTFLTITYFMIHDAFVDFRGENFFIALIAVIAPLIVYFGGVLPMARNLIKGCAEPFDELLNGSWFRRFQWYCKLISGPVQVVANVITPMYIIEQRKINPKD